MIVLNIWKMDVVTHLYFIRTLLSHDTKELQWPSPHATKGNSSYYLKYCSYQFLINANWRIKFIGVPQLWNCNNIYSGINKTNLNLIILPEIRQSFIFHLLFISLTIIEPYRVRWTHCISVDFIMNLLT